MDRFDNATGYRTTETCSHKCFYEYVNEEGNVAVSSSDPYTLQHEVDNPTTTIIWGTPKITKGGA